jgi:hypothetical protein
VAGGVTRDEGLAGQLALRREARGGSRWGCNARQGGGWQAAEGGAAGGSCAGVAVLAAPGLGMGSCDLQADRLRPNGLGAEVLRAEGSPFS